MTSSEKLHDVVILGGGFSGLGVALAAVSEGLRPLIIEQAPSFSDESQGTAPFAWTTSLHSHRIVHGGFRYLQQFNVPRVRYSAAAQAEVLTRFKEFVEPLSCVMPLERFGVRSGIALRGAIALYHLVKLGLKADGLPSPRVVASSVLSEELLPLSAVGPRGFFQWWDAQIINPLRMLGAIASQITDAGGAIVSDTEAVKVERSAEGFLVSLCNERGEEQQVAARRVVNTLGPAVNTLETEDISRGFEGLAWCKGYNLLLHRKVVCEHALAFKGGHGNMYFLTPRAQGNALGTRYVPFAAERFDGSLSEDEIMDTLSDASAAAPELALSISDLKGYEVGILPVGGIDSSGNPVPLGTSKIHSDSGYVEYLSTKFTTFLPEGRRILSAVL